MKNHLNILPKLASFDLKCSKMRWRLGLRPRPRWGAYDPPPDPLIVRGNALSALGSLYFVSIFTSQFPFRAPLTEFLDPPLGSATLVLLLNLFLSLVSSFSNQRDFRSSCVLPPHLFFCQSLTTE